MPTTGDAWRDCLGRWFATPTIQRCPTCCAKTGGRVPDNYLLYAVEKRIMAAAAVRIETLARGSADADSALVPETIWRPRVVAKERAEKLKRILRPAVAVARRLGLLRSGSTSSG